MSTENVQHNVVVAHHNNLVDTKEVSFFFKSVDLLDDAGKPTGEKFKRPTVELKIPVPSIEGIVKILETGGKGMELLQEAVADIVLYHARSIVNDDEKVTQETFPFDKLDWEYIANLPKAERRGGGIAKETWEDFGKDYISVMPAVTGKTAEQIGNAAKLLLAKFNPCKSNKKVLAKLKEQLGIYVTSSPNAETYQDCVAFLNKKADDLMLVDDAAMLENL